jgi:GntR family transcriptional repressor for pyruvate dehydrogenase complex
MSGLPSSVEGVASALREDILRRRIRPGERLPSERDLAECYGVNRGAVREALRVLEQLGIVKIGPGGARAESLEEASLDVLGHLLRLEERPDPQLVDQLLEAHAVLLSGWLRVLVDRGSDEQIEACCAVMRRLADPSAGEIDQAKHFDELVQLVGDSTNLVLRLMRRGLRMQIWEQLNSAGMEMRPPLDLISAHAKELQAAVAQRDGSRASEITYSMMKLHRERIVSALEASRPRAAAASVVAKLDAEGIAP